MYRRLLLTGCLLLLLFPACQQAGDGQLSVAFPLETTELAGGRSLRVTISLLDRGDQPIEGARVQAELQAPGGDVFATLACDDRGQGRYLADEYVQLPLRGASGTWRVAARATWGDGKQAQAERTFKGLPSLSEEIQNEFGFWIDALSVPGCDYNSLWHRSERREAGSGYVLMYNGCHGRVNLDVHWRQQVAFPADEAAASAYARDVAASAPHEEDYTQGLEPNLVAERTTFQGQPAWRVSGHSQHTHGKVRGGPVEWLIFRCPGSERLWTLIVSTSNEPAYMEHLRNLRETFECPTP